MLQLDAVTITTPCEVKWSSMSGSDRVRHCGACQRNVFNFDRMTKAEIETLLVEREGKLCARYFRRIDGTIATADCGRLKPAMDLAKEACFAGGLAVGTVVVVFAIFAVAIVVLFGDHFRRALGASAGGVGPMMSTPSPTPVAKPISTWGTSNQY